ncbi:hypothetical protein A1O3_01503 [Capronia epimyces CBS 606.96]|uniref:DUF7702 domain-containing protein n=1 Tax=Capronia epimyces CBS 606.96 TaxID=1182542 RepID=W9YJ87_9EURO|nr:uncharacterized protein A1O3_01503 [Capronia epimyces CBS 606.96]EXJ92947.1 hypothetical protein A1O3_01503 [Capronia epimyces CBS 606.96]
MSKWFSSKPIWTRLLLALRLLFVVAISLISAGGVVKGTADSTSQMRVGDDLVKAGYVILATIVAALFVVEVVIWRDHPALSFNITMTIAVAAFATILMAIRLVYGLLMVFDPTSRTWRGVQGSTAAYALMSLLPEYLVTVSLTAVGMMVASTL